MKTFWLLALAATALLAGCATEQQYRGVTVESGPYTNSPSPSLEEVKEMASKGVSDETITNTMRSARAVYQLNSEQIKELQEAKVSQPVIDYMLNTPKLFPPQPTVINRYYYDAYPPPYYYGPYWRSDWYWHRPHYGYHGHGGHFRGHSSHAIKIR